MEGIYVMAFASEIERDYQEKIIKHKMNDICGVYSDITVDGEIALDILGLGD